MSDRPEKMKHRLISEEAADWLLRLHEGSLSDRLEYVRWLKQSPAHVREMLELASLEGLLRSADLSDMPPRNDQDHDHTSPGPTFGPSVGNGSGIVELTPPRDDDATASRRSAWRHWKLAASACLSRIEFAGRAISRFVGNRG